MRTIYKYPLEIVDEQIIRLPYGADILCVAMQGSTLCLWALVETEEPDLYNQGIRIFGTGNPISNSVSVSKNRYIGTVIDGRWHVYIGDSK